MIEHPAVSGSCPHRGKICIVITTYNPESRITDVIRRAQEQADLVVVVDNSSQSQRRRNVEVATQAHANHDGLPPPVVVWNTFNRGVPSALNQGISVARQKGAEFVCLLDQDSLLERNCMDTLVEAFLHLETMIPLGAAFARNRDPIPLRAPGIFSQTRAMRDENGRTRFSLVPAYMVSGMLTRTSILESIGGFREDYFIDLFDTEMCLRMRTHGLLNIVIEDAIIDHVVGEPRIVQFGRKRLAVISHAPWRYYYMVRNTLSLAKEYHSSLRKSALGLLLVNVIFYSREILLSPSKQATLKFALHGVADYLRGITGRQIDAPRFGQ